MDEPREKENLFSLGDDLYGVSVAELESRIGLLNAEIGRIEAELAKKRRELDAAQQLFS